MKPIKKITALAIVLVMTFSAGACSCSSDGTTATNDEVATTVATVDELTAPTTVVNETTAVVQIEATTEAKKQEVDNQEKPQNNVSNNNNNKQDKPQGNNNVQKDVPVDNIDLSKISLSLTVGESKDISVTLYPITATDRSYTVKASNSNVSVSSLGNYVTIVGKKAGSSKVTVTSTNDKYAVCDVTVKKKNSPVNTQTNKPTTLSQEQMSSKANLDKVCDNVNQYFIDMGMQYTPSFTKDNSGWFVMSTFYGTFPGTVDSFSQECCGAFLSAFKSCAYVDGEEFNQELIEATRFRCYYEIHSYGDDTIYLCYG